MTHAPTPWSQYMAGTMLHGADGFYVGIMQGNNAEANAAYIVHCVNSHASLAEENKRMREALEEVATGDWNNVHWVRNMAAEVIGDTNA